MIGPGMAVLSVHVICVGRLEVYDQVELRIDYGVSKHFMYAITLFQSRDENAAKESFGTVEGTMIVWRAVVSVKGFSDLVHQQHSWTNSIIVVV